ncbi:hypothetical protein J4481_01060, partial [Candidatus Pacearchaeota archaeon]|nr:hypothetical protein [Candidatus Pacearchaeota archaeon]
SYFVLSKNHPETPEEIVKCIGENSVLYVQLGCSHCKTQEDMFGKNLKYLEIIDCWFEKEKCENISGTPTWKIKGEYYKGVQSIKKLQELTGC